MKKFQRTIWAILLIATISSCVPIRYGRNNGHGHDRGHDRHRTHHRR